MTYPRDRFGQHYVSPKTGQILDQADVKRLERLAKPTPEQPLVKGAAAKLWELKENL